MTHQQILDRLTAIINAAAVRTVHPCIVCDAADVDCSATDAIRDAADVAQIEALKLDIEIDLRREGVAFV